MYIIDDQTLQVKEIILVEIPTLASKTSIKKTCKTVVAAN